MKRKHADLAIEWFNDTSKVLQIKNDILGWVDIPNPSFSPVHEYRFKPREFNEGEWYQAVHNEKPVVIMYKDAEFDFGGFALSDEDFDWIGESLGKLKFG